jgi:uncharacterized protein (DUF2141 family)
MLQHFLKSWRANRGNLLAILGSLAALLMCVVWYFDLLPNIQLLPQDFSGVTTSRMPFRQTNPLVLTVKPPLVVPKADSEEQTKLIAIAELYQPIGELEADLRSVQSQTFALEPDRPVAVVFNDARPGKFSVVVFIDLNENGKLDFDDAGLPAEPFRISDNPNLPPTSLDLESAPLEIVGGETKLIEFDFRNRPNSPRN